MKNTKEDYKLEKKAAQFNWPRNSHQGYNHESRINLTVT